VQKWCKSFYDRTLQSPDFIAVDECASYSPDLNPLDYCIWDIRQDLVYKGQRLPIWIKFSRLVQNDMSTELLRRCVEMETRCRIPMWRTFGQIQCHVIPEPRITLQGAATWWIRCHDPRTTCHIARCSHLTKGVRIPSAILKIVFRHILFIFLFLLQFRPWRTAAFVSSPIHLLRNAFRHTIDTKTSRWLIVTLEMYAFLYI